jgi:hypothetical protein
MDKRSSLHLLGGDEEGVKKVFEHRRAGKKLFRLRDMVIESLNGQLSLKTPKPLFL